MSTTFNAVGSSQSSATASSARSKTIQAGVIGGFMSHFFFAIPLALIVKKRLAV
ncbi:MAG TPA: hypothetical protein VFL55_10385 [Acetobacteraceae bacterium]|nr:hypothetical protein [Acetobacteraceae bacterium]